MEIDEMYQRQAVIPFSLHFSPGLGQFPCRPCTVMTGYTYTTRIYRVCNNIAVVITCMQELRGFFLLHWINDKLGRFHLHMWSNSIIRETDRCVCNSATLRVQELRLVGIMHVQALRPAFTGSKS